MHVFTGSQRPCLSVSLSVPYFHPNLRSCYGSPDHHLCGSCQRVLCESQNLKSIEPAEASALNSAIHESAVPRAAKEELALVVMKQLSANLDAEDHGKGQVLLCPYNYCKQADIADFEDLMKTQQQVALRMRQCMKQIGCICPSETTFATMAAMLACLRGPTMVMAAFHAFVLAPKQIMSTTPGAEVTIKKYPELAKDLP